jgi:cell division protein ZapA
MAQVTIRINGYAYTVGCEDGQETHLEKMAAEIEQRIASIKAIGGQSGEARLLMLAALLLADELHDERKAGAAHAAAALAAKTAEEPAPKPDAEKRAKLRRLAARAEEIAADLTDA